MATARFPLLTGRHPNENDRYGHQLVGFDSFQVDDVVWRDFPYHALVSNGGENRRYGCHRRNGMENVDHAVGGDGGPVTMGP